MKRAIAAFSALALFGVTSALAQTSPGLVHGQVPTAAQWNSYFAAKQDVLGYSPVNKAGDVMTGKLVTAISTTTQAGLNLPQGAAPTSPINGDMWSTSVGIFVRINGATVGPLTSASAATFAATAPLAVTFPASVVTYAITGQAGAVLAGSGATFTPTPTLGVAGATLGTLSFANLTSGSITLQPVTGALGSSILSLPAATDTLLGRATTDTLTNKTFDTAGAGNVFRINAQQITGFSGLGNTVALTIAPGLSGGTHTALTALGIRSTGSGAFDLTFANTENLTAGRTLTISVADANRLLALAGNVSFAGATALPAIAQGDIWYGSATGVISALAKDTNATRALCNTGTTNNPAWCQIALTTGVTGILPVANGGTNSASASGTALDNISGFASTGFLTRTGAGTYAFQSATAGITNANLATMTAFSFKGNNTSGTASPTDVTVPGLTLKASPVSGDLVMIVDSAASNAWKQTTVGALASAGSVASLNTRTGALTLSIASQRFNGSGTYTPSTGLLYAIIECKGNGGGGGAAVGATAGAAYAGGGGGEGGYSRKYASAATIGASQSVTFGATGTGGAAGSNNGTAGGDVSVGSLCVGKGGSGGQYGSNSQVAKGGAGGVAGTGDFTSTGAPGSSGINSTGVALLASGNGGGQGGGLGVWAVTAATAGTNGSNYGAGGSGAMAHNIAANAAGGDGSLGVVEITEFLLN